MRKRLDKRVGKKLKGSLIIFANRAQVDGRLKARLSTNYGQMDRRTWSRPSIIAKILKEPFKKADIITMPAF